MPVGTKNNVIKGCGLHHIALQTQNWDASLRLYRDTLGMKEVARFGTPEAPIALFDMGDGTHMELFAPKTDTATNAPANQPIIHMALATTDTRASLERVKEAGYEITVEPKDVTLDGMDVTIAFFKGPNEEIIEFFQTH